MPATPASPHAEDDEAAKAERDDVERRRCWLAKLPAAYAPKHRPRYVLLNLDNTAASLVMSRLLFRGVEGARCPHDLRLNFEALTAHLCGTSTSALVVHQLATYGKTNPSIAQALEKFGWTLKPTGNDDNALQTELLTQLQKGAATANGKTLVLAMGGGSFGSGNTSAYHEIISKFLVEGWHVEIHAWLRALSDGYLRLQSEYPGRVVVKPLDDVIRDIVFVKRKGQSPTTAAKHVCSVLNQDDVPLKVVTSPLSDTASTASLSNTNCSDESPRAAIVSSIQTCVHSVPPATSPNASWIKATMQGQQKLRATTPTSNSPPVSPLTARLDAFVGAEPFVPHRSRAVSALPGVTQAPPRPMPTATMPPFPPASPTTTLPTAPMFTSPFAPTPSQPAYRWMLWELQLQQMRDLISAQQADLAMRQCALQQTTELMRLMQGQERKPWQSAGSAFPPPSASLSPFGGTWGL